MPVIHVSGIEIEVIRKKMKFMHLYVLPPDGSVRITAPSHVLDADIVRFASSKTDWIRQKQLSLRNRTRSTGVQYVSGEIHCLWGREYSLIVVEAEKHGVGIQGDNIYLYVRKSSMPEQREGIMNEWYRRQLGAILPDIVAKWENIIGVKANDVRIKNMKTRWGTCNVEKKRVWINLQLAKKPVKCLEYVVVHELVHIIEKSHSNVFKMHMDRFLPGWRTIKKELNR